MSAPDHDSRLMIVSNRLPVGIQCLADGRYEFSPSCGGLVTGLKGLAQNDVTFLWYGWPGTKIRHEQSPHLKKTLMAEFNAVPVLLSQQTAELYYNGFSSMSVTLFNATAPLSKLTLVYRLRHLAAVPLPARQSLLQRRCFRRVQEGKRGVCRHRRAGPQGRR
jgi:hypothetical protein